MCVKRWVVVVGGANGMRERSNEMTCEGWTYGGLGTVHNTSSYPISVDGARFSKGIPTRHSKKIITKRDRRTDAPHRQWPDPFPSYWALHKPKGLADWVV